jgi:hypothetical protein
LIIEQLVTLKNEFHRITDEKYQPVIGILRNLEVGFGEKVINN